MKKRSANIFLSIVMLLVAAAFFLEGDMRYPSNVLPNAVLVLISVLSLIILIRNIVLKDEHDKNGDRQIYTRVMQVVIGSVAYIAALSFIGFYITSFLYLIVLSLLLQERQDRNPRRAVNATVMAIVVCGLIYLMFSVLLRVPTPDGLLF